MRKQIVLVGGDKRTPYLANILKNHNYDVMIYGMDKYSDIPLDLTVTHQLAPADVYVLPIPITKNNITVNAPYSVIDIPIKELINHCNQETIFFGGNIPPVILNELTKTKCIICDYGKQEDFAVQNALPTAEGTIEILMNRTPYVLEGKSVCVVGFGRIGKVLANKLKALGCKVTLTSRQSAQLENIEKLGFTALNTLYLSNAPEFDILINTVPAPVITPAVLNNQNKSCFVVDLASKPGGVDFEYAKTRGIKTIHALSLPAKHAPSTAADIIAKTILEFLHETE